ncbi:hypothetical protein [Myroides odoratus]|uniref:hypothetical protein n=1 Tax=Myroides odoratus TaxID=256 RepID=UPI0007660AF6|nr:hypothetical protein [Myroides odoratus]
MMKLVTKVGICIVVLVLLYVSLSLVISKNQRFENYFYIKNTNLTTAKENNIFVKELDSLIIDGKQWVIFQSDFCFYKSYGFLQLLKHKNCPNDQFWIKIELRNNVGYDELFNYNVSYNGKSERPLFNDYNGYYIKIGDSLDIKIFDNEGVMIRETTVFLKE